VFPLGSSLFPGFVFATSYPSSIGKRDFRICLHHPLTRVLQGLEQLASPLQAAASQGILPAESPSVNRAYAINVRHCESLIGIYTPYHEIQVHQ
jgi:hypothetical protein